MEGDVAKYRALGSVTIRGHVEGLGGNPWPLLGMETSGSGRFIPGTE